MDAQVFVKAALLACVLLLAILFVAPGGSRRTAIRRILTMLLALAAGVAIILPDTTTAIARFVGIGRGADLLLYGLIVAFLGQVLRSRLERERMRRQITDLARAVALRDTSSRDDKP